MRPKSQFFFSILGFLLLFTIKGKKEQHTLTKTFMGRPIPAVLLLNQKRFLEVLAPGPGLPYHRLNFRKAILGFASLPELSTQLIANNLVQSLKRVLFIQLIQIQITRQINKNWVPYKSHSLKPNAYNNKVCRIWFHQLPRQK